MVRPSTYSSSTGQHPWETATCITPRARSEVGAGDGLVGRGGGNTRSSRRPCRRVRGARRRTSPLAAWSRPGCCRPARVRRSWPGPPGETQSPVDSERTVGAGRRQSSTTAAVVVDLAAGQRARTCPELVAARWSDRHRRRPRQHLCRVPPGWRRFGSAIRSSASSPPGLAEGAVLLHQRRGDTLAVAEQGGRRPALAAHRTLADRELLPSPHLDAAA